MGREFLFRGKRKNNGKWVESRSIMHYCQGIIKLETVADWAEVNPDTVCQYTGLIDKDGEKIFEGDIIRGRKARMYQIEYCNDIAGFIAKGAYISAPCMNRGTMECYEVIGNIFDNPELLEAAE